MRRYTIQYLHGLHWLRAATEYHLQGVWWTCIFKVSESTSWPYSGRHNHKKTRTSSSETFHVKSTRIRRTSRTKSLSSYSMLHKPKIDFGGSKWWVRLSKDRVDYLRQEMKIKTVYKAFIDLPDINGLWCGAPISILKCDKVG